VARYTDDSREKVRDAVDFAELVGAKTELKRSGTRRLQGLCPFHEERTPSFGIDPVEKLYHCFGCGKGGDVFSFVMETEGLDFQGALEALADRYGVELEREAEDPEDARRRVRRERLLALMERTAAYYVRVLWESAEAADARSYLASRGLAEPVLREFRVGYSPSRWDRVLVASRRAGYTESELFAAGLASHGREGRGTFDRFRGRIMFPLCDERGRVLGFGARALREDQRPKYLNTSDGEVFHKGRMVYGADLARADAARAGRVVLVEGYTDVIALRQAGVPEVVGSMGTALTEQQVDALRRLAPTVLFCQDPDAAGQNAVAKSAAALLDHNARSSIRGFDFRVVPLPAGEDPADVAVSAGGEGVRALLDRAVPFARFEVERALGAGDLRSTAGRDRVLDQVVPIIAPLPASVLREELIQLAAGRLGVTESTISAALADPARHARAEAARREEARAAARRSARRPETPARPEADPFAAHDPGPDRDGDPGPDEWSGGGAYDDPGPQPGPGLNGSSDRVLDRREQTERAFLAYCLALPDQGEHRLAEADLEELFASPESRRAAEYLKGRLRTPAADLPRGDDALARLIAELVIRAGELEATPAKLELEALQLDLSRLDRLIAGARVSGGEGMRDLATERQRVLDAIRHRLM
jgi:DNA primase